MVIFCHFTLIKTPKSKFWKMKTFAGYIIILHMCNKNHNHTMYSSPDMEEDRQNFLSFWAIFCPFSPLTNRKVKVLKSKKTNTWTYYKFTNLHHKWQLYDVWFLRYGAQPTKIFVILDYFLPFYPLWTKKINFFAKMNNTPEDIIMLQM